MDVDEAKVEVKIEPVEAPSVTPVVSVQTPVVKPIEKIKKVRTEAQKNQLKKAREKRKENSKKRKLVQQVVTTQMKDDDEESDEESNKKPRIGEPNQMKFSLKDSGWKWLALGGVTLAAGLSTSYIKSWDEYKPIEKKDTKEDAPHVKPPQNNREKRNDPLASFLP
jgi:hypothetical protein